MAVKFDMISEKGELFRQLFRQLDADLPGNIDDFAAQNAKEVVMAAGIGVVPLSLGIDGQFPEGSRLGERMQGVIDRRKGHGGKLLGNRLKNIGC